VNDMKMDDDFIALLEEALAQGGLDSLFQPFQQEQGVLDQEMALAQQLRQPGRERSTPGGALLGGLSNALGGLGGAVLQQKGLGAQRELGTRMQQDASGRMETLIRLLRQRKDQQAARQAELDALNLSPAEMIR
jgi:hypothetical protein